MQKTVITKQTNYYDAKLKEGEHYTVFSPQQVVSPTSKCRNAALILFGFLPTFISTAQISVKTNLLYDATLTPNIGVEWFAHRQHSLQIGYGYNPWTFGEGRKVRNWTVNSSYRYWWTKAGTGHFAGVQLQGGQYNMGGVRLPFWQHLATHRYEGWLAGAGLTYGYSLPLNHQWRVEGVVGIGYDYLRYKAFACPTCSEVSEHKVKHYIGPNQLALNLVFGF